MAEQSPGPSWCGPSGLGLGAGQTSRCSVYLGFVWFYQKLCLRVFFLGGLSCLVGTYPGYITSWMWECWCSGLTGRVPHTYQVIFTCCSSLALDHHQAKPLPDGFWQTGFKPSVGGHFVIMDRPRPEGRSAE